LPEGSELAVTIRYDEEAKVHVSAKELKSGKQAATEIIRKDTAVNQLEVNAAKEEEPVELEEVGQQKPVVVEKQNPIKTPESPKPKSVPTPKSPPPIKSVPDKLDRADRPVPLCNRCGEPLNSKGACPSCGSLSDARQRKLKKQKMLQRKKQAAARKAQSQQSRKKPQVRPLPQPGQKPSPKQVPPSGKKPNVKPVDSDDEILELPDPKRKLDEGEKEFWSRFEE